MKDRAAFIGSSIPHSTLCRATCSANSSSTASGVNWNQFWFVGGSGGGGGGGGGGALMVLPGDANLDGTVNGADLNIVLSNYNQTGMNWVTGDFNGDGTVNGADLNIVLSNYNQT